MNEHFETRLIECLDALENHQSIDDVLARYPDDADSLRAALAVAAMLPALSFEPEPAAQAASRLGFLAQAQSSSAIAGSRGRLNAAGGLVGLRAVVILIMTLVIGAIPVAASDTALPGDPLYGVKREVEVVRLQFAPSQADREALAADYNQRRVTEVEALLDDGRSAESEFEGRLDAIQPGQVIVSGLTITVPPGMSLPNLPLGTPVQVNVQVQNGQLTLIAIEAAGENGVVLSAQPPIVTPTETPTPGAQATLEAGSEPSEQPDLKASEESGETGTPESDTSGGGGETEATQSESGGGGAVSSPSGDGGGISTVEPGGGGSDGGSGSDQSGGGQDSGSDGGSGGSSGSD